MGIVSLFGFVTLLLPFAAGVFLLRLGLRYRRKSRLLQDVPAAPIDELRPGYAHVRGRVVCPQPLTSPLTQLPCAYFRTTVELGDSRPRAGTSRSSYAVIHSEPGSASFSIDDGTGSVLVNPSGATYDVPRVYTADLELDRPGLARSALDPSFPAVAAPSEQRLRDYVAAHAGSFGSATQGSAPANGPRYRVTEYCLPDKQVCSVLGICDAGNGASNGAHGAVLHQGTAQDTFLITSRLDAEEVSRLRGRAVAIMAVGTFLTGLTGLALLVFLIAAVV